MKNENKRTGKEQGKVGKNNPPAKSKFQKGKSGNPKGRPVGILNYSTVLNKILLVQLSNENLKRLKLKAQLKAFLSEADCCDFQELYWTSLLTLAINGNSKAIETIAHYAYGKPKDTINLNPDEPMKVEFVIQNANPFTKK